MSALRLIVDAFCMSEADQPNEQSERFKKMAQAIEHNQPGSLPFAGAAVIVPPKDGGDPVEVLLLDEKADAAQFWSTILTRIQFRIAELDDQRQKMQVFRR